MQTNTISTVNGFNNADEYIVFHLKLDLFTNTTPFYEIYLYVFNGLHCTKCKRICFELAVSLVEQHV